jgi:nicotinamidase-related amidase
LRTRQRRRTFHYKKCIINYQIKELAQDKLLFDTITNKPVGGINMSKQAQVLIVMDMQQGFSDAYQFNELVEKINDRIKDYKDAGLPVIFIQHNEKGLLQGSKEWELAGGLDAKPDDMTVQKTHLNAFYKTELNDLLTENGLNQLEICGLQTEYCVNATVTMAHGLGYELFMRPDMTTTYDNEYMTAEQTIQFFEDIWNSNFLKFI